MVSSDEILVEVIKIRKLLERITKQLKKVIKENDEW